MVNNNNNNNNNIHYLERIGSGGAGIHPFLQLLDGLNRILCDPKINTYFGSNSTHVFQKIKLFLLYKSISNKHNLKTDASH